MSSTALTFPEQAAHRAWLATQSALPRGFRVGTAAFAFTPFEVDKLAHMRLTLIVLDRPTAAFAAMFTSNAFPGAPVVVGRQRLTAPRLGAVLVNNKISNVCVSGGVEASEALCAAAAGLLGLAPDEVLPSSTGVIGWRLPVADMVRALPEAVAALQADSILPAAESICTTDLYPKVRRCALPGGGSVVGIAKGAGMIEPHLATMLAFLLTDADIPRDELREALRSAVRPSFNRISIDSDQSTSDTVVALASGLAPHPGREAFRTALEQVCADLAEDVVRNGEGVHHVMRVLVEGAPSEEVAVDLARSVANSPLWQCAVAGNDPNVGRLVAALGKEAGLRHPGLNLSHCRIALGGIEVFADGVFRLDRGIEQALVEHFRSAELYASVAPDARGVYTPPIAYPPHERRVEVHITLGVGKASAAVLGGDRTHEYISENADYRS